MHTLCGIKVVTAHCDHVTMACYSLHHNLGFLSVVASGIPVGGDLYPLGLFRSTSEQPRVVRTAHAMAFFLASAQKCNDERKEAY